MTLEWDCKKHKIHISMLDYIAKSQVQFLHSPPPIPQDQTHPHTKSNDGENCNMPKKTTLSPSLQNMKEVYLRSHRHYPLLHTGSTLHYYRITRTRINIGGQSDQKYHERD